MFLILDFQKLKSADKISDLKKTVVVVVSLPEFDLMPDEGDEAVTDYIRIREDLK